MSGYLAASIGLADGRIIRVGPDENQVGDIPTSFTFQTQIPGGFGPASLVIPRPPDLYADDARLFSNVVVYGEGMRVVYEGYITGIPQQSQDEIQLQITGWSTVLDRIANFRQLFVDRDLSRWRGPSAGRRSQILSSWNGAIGSGPSVTNDANSIATLALSPTISTIDEAWFDAGPGLGIKSLFLSGFTQSNGQKDLVLVNGINYGNLAFGFADSDSVSGYLPNGITDSNFDGQIFSNPAPGENLTVTASRPKRYAWVATQNGSQVPGRDLLLRGLTLYGNHNVTRVGPNPRGVFGSEAIAYMVGPTPLTILPESIESADFVIPHLSFLSDISIREAIEQINIFGGNQRVINDWGVYENREFFWRSPGSYGKTWRVSAKNLSNVRSDGPDSVLRTSGVKVNYQDEINNTRSVGPPGSFSDYETPRLLSEDADNPALRIPSYHTESVGVTSQRGAINIGRVILNDRNRLNWRGDLELQGEVMDSEGKFYPVHRVRAGDQVIVEDDDDRRPRPINSTSYSHDNLSLTASLGAVPDTLDSLLARLAAVTDLIV